MNWVYLALAVAAVIGIWDCKIQLGNIQRLLFEEQAKRNQREYNKQVWDTPGGAPSYLRDSRPE